MNLLSPLLIAYWNFKHYGVCGLCGKKCRFRHRLPLKSLSVGIISNSRGGKVHTRYVENQPVSSSVSWSLNQVWASLHFEIREVPSIDQWFQRYQRYTLRGSSFRAIPFEIVSRKSKDTKWKVPRQLLATRVQIHKSNFRDYFPAL